MRDMTKEEIKSLDKEHVLHSWSVQGTLDPMVVTKAEGIYFYDYDGVRHGVCDDLLQHCTEHRRDE